MINLCAKLPPTLGRAIANRADAEARRLQRAARQEGRAEPFDRHLADAVGGTLSGADTGAKPRRPELVVLVSHGVAQRGWTDVQEGELCKIPGVGPVAPEAAREIAEDAVPQRERSRPRTSLHWGPGIDRQSHTEMLEVPSGEDGARPQSREAPARGEARSARNVALTLALNEAD